MSITWPKDELQKIAEADDLHISPFREDGKTYGTPTWIWSVAVGYALYVRGYNGTKSSWYQAALRQKAGRITAAGMTKEVAFEPVNGSVNDSVDKRLSREVRSKSLSEADDQRACARHHGQNHATRRQGKAIIRRFVVEIRKMWLASFREGSEDYFTGTVCVDPLFEAADPARARAASVTFEPGARTAWHTGQTLIVTSGLGSVQRWGGPVDEIRPGDVVWFEPNEKHWHGASPSVAMTVLLFRNCSTGKSLTGWKKSLMSTTTDKELSAGRLRRRARIVSRNVTSLWIDSDERNSEMAHYLVRARPKPERLRELSQRLEHKAFVGLRPFGKALTHSLENARIESDGTAIWEEEDYCSPPLAEERAAVLDLYFDEIDVEPVNDGQGWDQVQTLPRLITTSVAEGA